MFDKAEKLYEEEKYEEALKLYQQLEFQNHAEAIYSIGWFYEHGLAVETNYEIAMEKYKKAFSLGYIKAAKRTGLLYDKGGFGLTQNYEEATCWLEKAIENGDHDVYIILGNIYKEKFQNPVKEKATYEKGAELGNPDCLAALAQWYLENENDLSNALKYAKKADEAGSELGTLMLYSVSRNTHRFAETFYIIKRLIKFDKQHEEKFDTLVANVNNSNCDIKELLLLARSFYDGIEGQIYFDHAAVCINKALQSMDVSGKINDINYDIIILAAKLYLDKRFKSHNFEAAVKLLEVFDEVPSSKKEIHYMLAKCYDTPSAICYKPNQAESMMKQLARNGYEPAKKYCEKYAQKDQYIANGLCSYCGGNLKGLFKKKCVKCGKNKNY